MAEKYIHVDNGGIEVEVNESEYEDYILTFKTTYYGYPFTSASLSGLSFEQLEEISQFLSKEVAKIKLKR